MTLIASLIAAIGVKLIGAAIKAIYDVTVQDFWKDTISPYLSHHVGPWSTAMIEMIGPYLAGFCSALALMFVVEMIFAIRRSNNAKQIENIKDASEYAHRALIRLRFSGKLEPPDAIYLENIQSWFTYWSPGVGVKDQDGRILVEAPPSWAIFLVFEKPVDYSQILANFTGGSPQAWQPRQALRNVCVVTMEGSVPACEMEIVTKKI
ncbi:MULTISPECIES: hypothetical protein [Methylobacterium]|uniref:hypothetical protein n=1 Tax=Methylobacterium TaxID=407 RepID=UPI00272EA9FE|nr:hypothetical protein [Methylobacterium sp.]